MAGLKMFAEQLQVMSPHTCNALQRLVTSMADVVKNADKKTIFGRDKGVVSYQKFLVALKATLHAMVLDKLISESASTDEAIVKLEEKLQKFSMAYPNWQDAYGFAATFFGERRRDAIATIDRLRFNP
jgi:folylpolyglutamate synthase/dihydropteroate synthase